MQWIIIKSGSKLTSVVIPSVSPTSVAHQTIKYEKKIIHSIEQMNVHIYKCLFSYKREIKNIFINIFPHLQNKEHVRLMSIQSWAYPKI